MNPKQRMDELPRLISIFLLFSTVAMFVFVLYYYVQSQDTNEINREQQEQLLDNHCENIMFYPDDAVYHLQKSLTGEGYPCEMDGVLGNETIKQYNQWRVNNE